MKTLNLMAFDYGASSGRGILGQFDGEELTIREIHRFSNNPVEIAGHLHWDILKLFWEMKQGVLAFKNYQKGELASIGIDSWGVDFGLLDHTGDLLGNPYHYRDSHTEGIMEKAFERMSKTDIYHTTGIAFEIFNTLYRLLALRLQKPEVLDQAETLLFIPDLLMYFLTGEKTTEYTNASTSQLLGATQKTWSRELIRTMDFPEKIFTPIQQPGTCRGYVVNQISEELGIGQVPVVTVATHDTASAIVAVPASEQDVAYVSSGTWSLIGVEVDSPIIDENTFTGNYTNEGGCGGTYCLLKNIMGLWLVQECKREWDRQGKVSDFSELTAVAASGTRFQTFINPGHPAFYSPGDMPGKIQSFCADTNQAIPQTRADILRCIFESLALKYRAALEQLEEITRRPFLTLHIVGGGAKNTLLNQCVANALNKPVICGPTEATAIGNVMMQALALGEVGDIAQIRQVIRQSFSTETYLPENTSQWDEAYERFLKIV